MSSLSVATAEAKPMNLGEELMGPMFIGLILNVLFQGVIFIQTYLYFAHKSHRDRSWFTTVFVSFLLLANVLHTVFIAVDVYLSLVVHYNDPKFLMQQSLVLGHAEPTMTGIISGAVQLFFSWRVRVLTKNLLLGIVMALVSLVSTVAAIATTCIMSTTPNFRNNQAFEFLGLVWLVTACIADVMITTSLVVFLQRHKTGFKHCDALMDRIIRLAIQTGLLTSLCIIVDLITHLVCTGTEDLICNFILAKFYTNMLLSSLNARDAWSEKGTSPTHESFGMSAPRPISGTLATKLNDNSMDKRHSGGSERCRSEETVV
ncbi:hypothetical protein CYLTODRAFT_458936 [Cylindrobasidium torrendii FP15055 ss-10]|uniref:DUF6534 domain-containing protein n=1 Tax=Cylindrobasidium torrendii FP15055 ss-10 TaxID=1314674 RepID=A0A0D7AXB0_9AGAR|nr:hypothetical protein CYLTODRAFT_458936 [Cylindrobasidium torrendii FP15055 ss-10]